MSDMIDCPFCRGTGKVINAPFIPCYTCSGSGKVDRLASKVWQQVDEKIRISDDITIVKDCALVIDSYGGENVTLSSDDIGHIQTGGIVIVTVNGGEYVLMISFDAEE